MTPFLGALVAGSSARWSSLPLIASSATESFYAAGSSLATTPFSKLYEH
jgi:hypothetical protein